MNFIVHTIDELTGTKPFLQPQPLIVEAVLQVRGRILIIGSTVLNRLPLDPMMPLGEATEIKLHLICIRLRSVFMLCFAGTDELHSAIVQHQVSEVLMREPEHAVN